MHDGFAALRGVCDEAVAAGVIPGAAIVCAEEGQTLFCGAFGARQIEPDVLPASVDTVYDVASLTKAVVTSVLAMRAVGDGTISLESPVATYLPEFQGDGKATVTVRHLLCHASGLPAHRPYYQHIGGPSARSAIALAAAREPLEGAPGVRSVYTDLGFILLGWILERVMAERLDMQFGRAVEPLGLSATGFVDLEGGDARARLLAKGNVAPTERCPIRGRLLIAEVHDQNAFAMGGVAGHAGLFSNARDLGTIAAALLAAWRGEGGDSIVERDVIREFWRPAGIAGSTWRLGWDGPAAHESQGGKRLSREAVGHLGFTGCSLWIEPPSGRVVVLLSNRVHPTLQPDDPRFRVFRPAVQDAAIDGMTGRRVP
jgi:CubicO group peptidase (beta-lactamase class C family)